MAIVGFNFNKVYAERNDGVAGGIKISNNVSLSDVKEAKLSFVGQDDMGITFFFTFTSIFDTDAKTKELGKIELNGSIVHILKKDVAKDTLASWKKDKKIDDKLLESILNYALEKCNVEAIILSKEMNLPPPVKMPRIVKKD